MFKTVLIAKKEFSDVIHGKFFYIVLAVYFFIFFSTFFTNVTDRSSDGSRGALIALYVYSLSYYGTLVAMAMAYSSLFSELDGKAIATLLTKPLYRDTIINGKFLNALAVAMSLFGITTTLSIVMAVVFFDEPMKVVNVLLMLVPIMFVLTLLSIMFFYSVTTLICVTVKDQILSLFTSFLAWIFIFHIINDDWFAGYISYFFHSHNLVGIICGLSPYTLVNNILTQQDVINAMLNGQTDLVKLVLYTAIVMVVTYSVFIRSDIN